MLDVHGSGSIIHHFVTCFSPTSIIQWISFLLFCDVICNDCLISLWVDIQMVLPFSSMLGNTEVKYIFSN